MPSSRSGFVAALFAYVALAWGGSYVAISVGLHNLPPVFFAASRLDIAAVVLVPSVVAWYDDWRPKTTGDWVTVCAAGLFVAAGTNAFLFLGQESTPSAVAAVVFALNPILATLFAWLLLPSERLSPLSAFGVCLGILGVAIIANPDPDTLLSARGIGPWILLCGAACLGLGTVLTRRFETTLPTLVTTSWGLLLGGLFLHAVSYGLGERVSTAWGSTLLLSVAYLGIVATAGAYSAYFELISRIGAVRTALVSYVVPVVTAIAGWVLVGETITLHTVAGFLVIAVGFALTERRTLLSGLRKGGGTETDA
ncbi:DMT family transporter [Haladaptatus sp. CMAA 1911]|uniref:DMT family transporter n=1 Tax=unclassified Haladaptatus TaxID=2622732 RepID=UPI003753FBAC